MCSEQIVRKAHTFLCQKAVSSCPSSVMGFMLTILY